jgi:hypothetical protein
MTSRSGNRLNGAQVHRSKWFLGSGSAAIAHIDFGNGRIACAVSVARSTICPRSTAPQPRGGFIVQSGALARSESLIRSPRIRRKRNLRGQSWIARVVTLT